MSASAFAHLVERSDAIGTADPLAIALHEAVRGVGRTAPNPPVGAVVVKDGVELGRGFHAKAGERHGEIVALDEANAKHGAGAARGSTLYVTLEPCVHFGRTPPCVDRILAEGVARVVVGAVDPNPKVHEKGIAKLRAAGVEVDVADSPQCRALIAPFSRALVDGRAYTVLKIASSLDGRVATKNGASRWITGAAARALVHRLRDAVDAVVVGAGTVIADDPALTVRDVAGRDPRRYVIDSRLRTSPTARVQPATMIHVDGADAGAFPSHHTCGSGSHVDLHAALAAIAKEGATSALIEAGPGLASALLQAGLVDELWWFSAPILLGGDSVPAVGPLGLAAPSDAARLNVVQRAVLDEDALTIHLVNNVDRNR